MTDEMLALRFYRNEIPSRPAGAKIERILNDWIGDWVLLETHHGWVQWLFPLAEPSGANPDAPVLSEPERRIMSDDQMVRNRFMRAYALILDFWGIRVRDWAKGTVCRLDEEHAAERLHNLDRSSHNHLRVSRVLKCLPLLGFAHFQEPLLEFLIREIYDRPRALESCALACTEYWLPTVVNDRQRRWLTRLVRKLSGTR